jgi:peptidoglycan/xylan/chitin deacetylase (PgdA/CDA1 family)
MVISLDLEMEWGRGQEANPVGSELNSYLGEREAINRLLALFEEFEIAATWATVGFLFAETRAELDSYTPRLQPHYEATRLNPYTKSIGSSESDDPLHYASSVLRRIAACPGQEIATHTFSHYYCLEPGQSVDGFSADLSSAIAIASAKGIQIDSLVFPRNQYNPAYLSCLRDAGIRVFRGNQQGWMHEPTHVHGAVRRLSRLADAYVDFSGDGTFGWSEVVRADGLCDVRASRFLRPYLPRLRALERLRLSRILSSLEAAAEHNRIFHLWSHPHNFGFHTEEAISFLREILTRFSTLRRTRGMMSLSMKAAGEMALQHVI